ncbi:hypothetical protein MNBD_GAMMA12-1973 [hydrothermal vent metagenome]|uniref:3-oxoacyl-[acyl-carrier-protein] reductase n=1 Tax=hydrothermal vent metagenome TaxID=652676 RepID=A0A3B0YZ21_9ZZZZ
MTKAFVTGATGAVGEAVLSELAKHNIDVCFSYYRSEIKANALASQYEFQAIKIDLRDLQTVKQGLSVLHERSFVPDIFIHCAAIASTQALEGISLQEWEEMHAVNCGAALVICQELIPGMSANKNGDILFVGALDQSQSIPLPVHFSATQGALQTMAMALSKEFGSVGIRVNMISTGLLTEGLSDGFEQALHEDYLRYSCLKRKGTPEELAKVISWFARENRYVSGKVIPVNGGI